MPPATICAPAAGLPVPRASGSISAKRWKTSANPTATAAVSHASARFSGCCSSQTATIATLPVAAPSPSPSAPSSRATHAAPAPSTASKIPIG